MLLLCQEILSGNPDRFVAPKWQPMWLVVSSHNLFSRTIKISNARFTKPWYVLIQEVLQLILVSVKKGRLQKKNETFHIKLEEERRIFINLLV